MRPLAVLLLVLGAIAALFFAFDAIAGDRSPKAASPGLVTRPALAEEDAPAPDPDAPIQRIATPIETGRTAAETRVEQIETDTDALTGVIRGEVTTLDGIPIEKAQVSLILNEGGEFGLTEALGLLDSTDPPEPVKRAVTRGDGRFQFRGITPGSNWYVIVTHRSYPRTSAGPIEVPPTGGVDERVILRSGLAMFGTVTEAATGMPIQGAQLVVTNPIAEFVAKKRGDDSREVVETDEAGRFEFQKIGSGQRTLEIRAPGYATMYVPNFGNVLQQKNNEARKPKIWRTNRGQQLQEIAAMPNEPVEMNYELEVGQNIAGRVLGPNREGLAGVTLKATNVTANAGSRGETVSVEGGEFLIQDLGEGIYSLLAEAKGYEITPLQRVEIGKTDVEIVLAAQGGVAGRVLDAETGRALSRFTVRIRQHNPRNVAWGGEVAKRQVRDRSDGAFSVNGISQGTYVVEATSRGFASSFSAPFEVQQGIQTQDIVVRVTKGGVLRGRVVDGLSKEPISGALVKTNDNNWVDSEIMQLLGGLNSSATSKVSTKTDENGEFELKLLTPDVYQVRVEKQGFTAVTMNDVQVENGPPTTLPQMELLKGATITGFVMGPFDDPVPGANVSMRASDGNYFDTYQARTDANGFYTIRNAKAGVYKLHASRPTSPNSSPFAPVLDLQQSEIEISIAEGGRYDYPLQLPAVRE